MSETVTETVATPSVGAAAPLHANAERYPVDAVWVERRPDQGLWVLGVTFKGSDHVFGTRKLGGIDDDVREALEPGFKAKRAQTYLDQLRLERG